MEIRQPLTIDLALQLPALPVPAVQGDGNTRVLEITLLENGEPWQIPESAVADVAFRKPDGTKGIYSRLPDGSSATGRSGNVLSATMAPQMLTCPGSVLATVVFRTDGGKTLAAFPFTVAVAPNPAAGAQLSEDYFNPTQISDLRAELAAGLATKAPAGYGLGSNATYIDDNKELKDVTLTGFYFWSDVSTASDKPFSAGDLLVIKRTDSIIDQIAFGHDTVDHQIRIRKIINGEETEWEWVNPPMATGVEYRTAERFDGSPVYTKLVYFGNLPNNGAGSVAWSPDSGYAGFIIDARVIAGGNFINLEHSANSSALWIVTNADYSDTTAAVLLKYTKA